MSSKIKDEIQQIMRETSLTNQEKNRMIQNVYSSNINDNVVNNKPLGTEQCYVYPNRKCRIVAFCCGGSFCCRICHDEVADHLIDRFKTTTIICNICNTKQNVDEKCSSCNIDFDRNFCFKCKLWTSIDMFHCEYCDVCRVGCKTDYEHCFDCNICCTIGHNCMKLKLSLNENCCICFEKLKNSMNSVIPIPCGHCLHKPCLLESIRNGNIGCPLCKKSIGNFSDHWDTLRIERDSISIDDPELSKPVNIICNDCEHHNTVTWHIVGLECPDCNSFNTTRI